MNWSLFFKVMTGIVVVPVCITAHHAWPLWTGASIPVRILSGPIVLPLTGAAALLMPWWENM